MKLLQIYLTVLGLTTATTHVHAGAKESFVKGNLAYGEANYQEAINHYQTALHSQKQLSSNGFAQIHYNLGNAYLRHGQLGASIASYLKSLAQRPLDEDLIANLHFARSQTKDELQLEETSPILRTIFFWHFATGRNQAVFFLLIVNAIFWLTMALRLFALNHSALVLSQRLAFLATVLIGTSVLVRWVHPEQIAVVQKAQSSVFAGQDSASVIRFKLHEGSEVRAVEVDGSWVKVDLPEQKQGWIKATDVVVIKL